jgi:enoyl-CoA hydratase/carnithine racemase
MSAVLQETEGAVAWVWLNRPERLNVIDEDVLSGLQSAFRALSEAEPVRVIVLSAKGSAFSGGFDLERMLAHDAASAQAAMAGIYAAYDAVVSCPKPVIAAIPGVAAGGGLLLALAADIRLAADGAAFLAPEVRVGLFPALGLVPLLERTVGVGAARRMLLTGGTVGPRDALRIGLVDELVPTDDLASRARDVAAGIAALPAFAVRQTKAAFSRTGRPDYAEWERAQLAACWVLPERAAAMRAFLERGKRGRSST